MTSTEQEQVVGRHDARRVFATVALVLTCIYLATAQWGLPYHGDGLTNAITGWRLGTEGTVISDAHAPLTASGRPGPMHWFVDSPRGVVGQYPPGTAVAPALVYAVVRPGARVVGLVDDGQPGIPAAEVPVPPLWPATLSAVVTTALAMAVLGVVFLEQTGSRRRAVLGAIAMGLATAAWSVAANLSWYHGPAMLTIAVAVWAASRDRWLLAGSALGMGVFIRPPVAVIAAVLGLGVGLLRRDARPVVLVGLGSGLGLAGVLVYNWWLWSGTVTLSGGYQSNFAERVVVGDDYVGYGTNLLLAMFDPGRGLLVWAPFLLILVPAAWLARQHQPDWAAVSAVAGVVYLLVVLRVIRHSGGSGFFGYRYPLEALVAAAPALMIGYDQFVRQRPRLATWTIVLVVLAGAGQLVGALGT